MTIYKEPKVSVLQANDKLVQKVKCWTWSQRSRGSILTGGNIFTRIFCFHIVKLLMPILVLLPMWCFCENPERQYD